MFPGSLFDKLNEFFEGTLEDSTELHSDDTDSNELEKDSFVLSSPSAQTKSKSTRKKQKCTQKTPEESFDEPATTSRRPRRSVRLHNRSTSPTPTTSSNQHGVATRLATGRRGRRGASTAVTNAERNARTSHRVQVAEAAARAPVLETIDLITSPLPSISGVLSVDTDDESDIKSTTATEKANIMESSFDDENREVSLKVRWRGEVLRFGVRRYQKLTQVYRTLAERENAEIQHVVLTLNDRILSADDTPESINYKIYNFIDGRILVRSLGNLTSTGARKVNPNHIKLKIQSDKWKRPKDMEILKSDKLKILYIKCGEELNIPSAKIKLSFDGDVLDPKNTPSDYEFEGGEVVDVVVKE